MSSTESVSIQTQLTREIIQIRIDLIKELNRSLEHFLEIIERAETYLRIADRYVCRGFGIVSVFNINFYQEVKELSVLYTDQIHQRMLHLRSYLTIRFVEFICRSISDEERQPTR